MPDDRGSTPRRAESAGPGRPARVLLALAALSLSGCAIGRGDRPGGEAPLSARLQDPGKETEEDGPETPAPPPIPSPDLPATGPEADRPEAEAAPAPPPSPALPVAGRRRDAVDRNAPALQGLSSIARNRALNRMAPDDQAEEEADFPDIREDPLGRAGVPIAERDPFLFPWLMNLIYEDRWGLETDPIRARTRRIRERATIDIRDPDPDTANFPNGAYTLAKGRAYLETSPVGFYGPSRVSPSIYQWDFLLRYGLTDNLEFRIFSNGLTVQGAKGRQPAVTGFSPLAFDFKANFWEENPRYHIPAVGAEIYLQTTLGSPAFNGGTQPSINLLFDQSLPLEVGFEWNVGITGVQTNAGLIAYEFSSQWSFQREVVEDFDIFFHGFYNAAALPRLLNVPEFGQNAPPKVVVAGVGGIWTVNDRLALFGSYNFGLTSGSPSMIALSGFAVAF